MPRVKLDDEDFNIDELEGAEYDPDKEFTPYQGAVPPKETLLGGRVKKMWYTWTRNGDPMFKIIFEAETPSEYDGLGVWDNVTMNAKSKWRWKPFIDALGISLMDIKNRMNLDEEENEKLGQPVNKIGKFVPGEDSPLVMIITGRDTRDSKNPKATVAKWLEYDEDVFDEDAEEEDEDEEMEDEEDEEEDELPARPTRKTASGRASQRAVAKPSASKAAGRPSRPVRDGKRSTSSAPTKSVSKSKVSSKPASKRRRPADDDDEAPF